MHTPGWRPSYFIKQTKPVEERRRWSSSVVDAGVAASTGQGGDVGMGMVVSSWKFHGAAFSYSWCVASNYLASSSL